jgi:hypothetical protein
MKALVWIVSLGLISCTAPKENEAALLQKQGIQKISIGDVRLASRLMSRDEPEQGGGYVYFNVKIEKTDTDRIGKEQALYLAFDIQQDFVLKAGGRQILPGVCQKIENGRKDIYEYVVAFEAGKELEKEELTLLYKDKIFGVGTVAFVYDQADLKNFEPKS